jgi:hypothetical protein
MIKLISAAFRLQLCAPVWELRQKAPVGLRPKRIV